MLTTFLLLPLAGVLMIAFLPRHREQDARVIALVVSVLALAVFIRSENLPKRLRR